MPLHRYFIDHTIRAEQEDYETEGVEWEHVEYFNNKVRMIRNCDTAYQPTLFAGIGSEARCVSVGPAMEI